MRALGFKI
uniref:Uncharacterized protein DKFZp469A2113 n=1 Tax=Pongo abelii TaxID=9601 RepID=Q5RC44_PONAB|nr:hypothetical protein [Pongo abelii]